MENKHILNKGNSGWCSVKIDEFSGSASYVTDVPMDFLNAFKIFIDTGAIPVVFCDEEGSEFRIIVEEFYTYIISEREDAKLIVVEMDRREFVDTILSDIEGELDWFAVEFADDITDENDVLQRKINILTTIQYIRNNFEVF